MQELIIDREKWLRGPDVESYLRDEYGKMCCLGFEALRRGISPEDIQGRTTPAGTAYCFRNNWIDLVEGEKNTELCRALMEINDANWNILTDSVITEEEREEKIAALFATIDVQVKFVGSHE